MLENPVTPVKALRFALYGRSSIASINANSVNQQFLSIRAEIKRQNRPWVEVATYQDMGVSGQCSEPLGLRSMLDDLREGRLEIDAILVTSLDRISRDFADSLVAKELSNDCRICVLAADTGFA